MMYRWYLYQTAKCVKIATGSLVPVNCECSLFPLISYEKKMIGIRNYVTDPDPEKLRILYGSGSLTLEPVPVYFFF